MTDVSFVKSFYLTTLRRAQVNSDWSEPPGKRVRDFLWSQMERWRDRRLRSRMLARYGARLLRDMGVVEEDQFGRPCGRANDGLILPWHFTRPPPREAF